MLYILFGAFRTNIVFTDSQKMKSYENWKRFRYCVVYSDVFLIFKYLPTFDTNSTTFVTCVFILFSSVFSQNCTKNGQELTYLWAGAKTLNMPFLTWLKYRQKFDPFRQLKCTIFLDCILYQGWRGPFWLVAIYVEGVLVKNKKKFLNGFAWKGEKRIKQFLEYFSDTNSMWERLFRQYVVFWVSFCRGDSVASKTSAENTLSAQC